MSQDRNENEKIYKPKYRNAVSSVCAFLFFIEFNSLSSFLKIDYIS